MNSLTDLQNKFKLNDYGTVIKKIIISFYINSDHSRIELVDFHQKEVISSLFITHFNCKLRTTGKWLFTRRTKEKKTAVESRIPRLCHHRGIFYPQVYSQGIG